MRSNRKMAQIIDGRAVARELDEKTKADVEKLLTAGKPRLGLAAVIVGDDPASEVYVCRTMKRCENVGICSFKYRLPKSTTQDALLALIARLNLDRVVHGISVQVPLPEHIDTRRILCAIHPDKDVEGFHPINVGRLSTSNGGIVPCTPLGVMKLLETVIDDFVGLEAVLIGKSNIVGKPMAMLLLDRECRVSVTQTYTENHPDIARKADIIVAAAGVPELVRGDWVKPGAVVIDAGITRIMASDGKEKLVGDVKFNEVQHAKAVSAVPGGVGPMAIACLLHNTVQAAKVLYQ